MQITIVPDACVGAGQCALVADQLFDQDDDGLVIVLDDTPSGADEASARRAASLCPARAIKLLESA